MKIKVTKKDKNIAKFLHDKEYVSTYELVKQDWFPIKSVATLIKLVEAGEINAINVGVSAKRYKFTKEEIIKYLVKLDEQKRYAKKRTKAN
jgi:hypothetical protein